MIKIYIGSNWGKLTDIANRGTLWPGEKKNCMHAGVPGQRARERHVYNDPTMYVHVIMYVCSACTGVYIAGHLLVFCLEIGKDREGK